MLAHHMFTFCSHLYWALLRAYSTYYQINFVIMPKFFTSPPVKYGGMYTYEEINLKKEENYFN